MAPSTPPDLTKLSDILNARLDDHLSVLNSQRMDALTWQWNAGHVVLTDGHAPANFTVVGLVGRERMSFGSFCASRSSESLDFCTKANTELSIADIEEFSFHLRAVPPLPDVDPALHVLHSRISSTLRSLSESAASYLETRFGHALPIQKNWLTHNGYNLDTSNIFTNTSVLATHHQPLTAAYPGNPPPVIRVDHPDECDFVTDENGVRVYTLLDWPGLEERTRHFGVARNLVRAHNFSLVDADGSRLSSIRFPDVVTPGTPFVAEVQAYIYLTGQNPHQNAETSLRISSLHCLQSPYDTCSLGNDVWSESPPALEPVSPPSSSTSRTGDDTLLPTVNRFVLDYMLKSGVGSGVGSGVVQGDNSKSEG